MRKQDNKVIDNLVMLTNAQSIFIEKLLKLMKIVSKPYDSAYLNRAQKISTNW